MKKITIATAAFVLLLFVGAEAIFAENSVSISVSATVPAIPGVNAPLLEVQSKRLPQENQAQQLPLIAAQEESKGEKADSQSQDEIVLVKTFYVR